MALKWRNFGTSSLRHESLMAGWQIHPGHGTFFGEKTIELHGGHNPAGHGLILIMAEAGKQDAIVLLKQSLSI